MLMLNRAFASSLQSNLGCRSGVRARRTLFLNALLDLAFYHLGVWGIPLSTAIVNIAGTIAPARRDAAADRRYRGGEDGRGDGQDRRRVGARSRRLPTPSGEPLDAARSGHAASRHRSCLARLRARRRRGSPTRRKRAPARGARTRGARARDAPLRPLSPPSPRGPARERAFGGVPGDRLDTAAGVCSSMGHGAVGEPGSQRAAACRARRGARDVRARRGDDRHRPGRGRAVGGSRGAGRCEQALVGLRGDGGPGLLLARERHLDRTGGELQPRRGPLAVDGLGRARRLQRRLADPRAGGDRRQLRRVGRGELLRLVRDPARRRPRRRRGGGRRRLDQGLGADAQSPASSSSGSRTRRATGR